MENLFCALALFLPINFFQFQLVNVTGYIAGMDNGLVLDFGIGLTGGQ